MVKYNTIFYKNGVTLHVCVHGHPIGNIFLMGALVDVCRSFSRGAKVVKFVFYH